MPTEPANLQVNVDACTSCKRQAPLNDNGEPVTIAMQHHKNQHHKKNRLPQIKTLAQPWKHRMEATTTPVIWMLTAVMKTWSKCLKNPRRTLKLNWVCA